jgi:hypothetical protein
MIVITGVGRSGTSLIASLYQQLGFAVGGEWVPTINAGLEDPQIVEANEIIMSELRLTGFHRTLVPPSVKRLVKRHVSASTIERVRERTDSRPRMQQGKHLSLLDWDRLPQLVEKMGPRLCDLAATRQVAKDPRFRYTMPAWLASGASVDHALISLRNLDAAMKSKVAAGYEDTSSEVQLRNWLVYGFGLCLDALLEHKVEHALVRFPDFLGDPQGLYRAMRFPEPVDEERFLSVFGDVVRPEMVHH